MGMRTSFLGSLIAAAAFIACIHASKAEDQIKIGAIVPSSGPFAEWGRANTATLTMLEKQINDAGGVNGAKLKIVIYDDGAKPAEAANALRKLAGDDGVLAIAGPLTSSACEVTFPVANQSQIVSTSQASSKPGVAKANRPWAFRDTVDEGILAKTSVPYFKTAFGVKSVVVIYDAKDAVSTAIATKIMPKVLAADGIQVLNENDLVSFNTGDLDVSAQITKLKALKSGRCGDRGRLQPGHHGNARNEAPGIGEAGHRRYAFDLFGHPQSGAGNPDCGPGNVLRHHEDGRRRRSLFPNCNRCCARPRACPPISSRTCTTPISMRSSACTSTR